MTASAPAAQAQKSGQPCGSCWGMGTMNAYTVPPTIANPASSTSLDTGARPARSDILFCRPGCRAAREMISGL